jgi:hypothetical protein
MNAIFLGIEQESVLGTARRAIATRGLQADSSPEAFAQVDGITGAGTKGDPPF